MSNQLSSTLFNKFHFISNICKYFIGGLIVFGFLGERPFAEGAESSHHSRLSQNSHNSRGLQKSAKHSHPTITKSERKIQSLPSPQWLSPMDFQLREEIIDNSQIYQPHFKYSGEPEYKILAEIKQAEIQHKYDSCAELGLKALKKLPSYASWIAVQSMDCLIQDLNGQIQRKSSRAQGTSKYSLGLDLPKRWLKAIDQTPLIFGNQASRPTLLIILPKFITSFALQNQFPDKIDFLDRTLRLREGLDTNERSQIFTDIATRALGSNQKDAALYFFERAYQQNKSRTTSEQIALLSGKTPESVLDEVRQEIASSNEEESAYQKWLTMNIQDSQQLVSFFIKGVEFLNQFPGGIRSNQVSEKVINIYLNRVDTNDANAVASNKNNELDRILSVLSRAHSSRLAEWIKTTHRRLDFYGTYTLFKALPTSSKEDPQMVASLYLGNRAAEFLGKYQEALEGFQLLSQKFSGYSEIVEIRHRVALMALRMGNSKLALDAFGEVLNSANNKNYELAALYWSYRILSSPMGGSPSPEELNIAQDYLQKIQKKYSLSYYGLLLASEKNGGKLEWSPVPFRNQKFRLWVTPDEKQAISRAQILSQVGWFSAAQNEIEGLSPPPKIESKVILAQFFASLNNYPLAIRLLTEAGNADEKFQSLDYAKLGYPQLFKETVQLESNKYRLDPYLILGLIRQESAFSLKAVSGSQAQGLMQMIPPTAKEVAADLKVKDFIASDIFDPFTNIKFGTYYLKKVTKQFSDNIPLGLAAYNAGPHRLKKFLDLRADLRDYQKLSQGDYSSDLWIEELPWIETNLYVKSILRNALIYRLLNSKSVQLQSGYPLWKSFL